MTVRSWLFLPANRPDRLTKAMSSGADAVILDLEDAVAPDQKDIARALMLQALGAARPVTLAVRINPIDTGAGLADMLALIAVVAIAANLAMPAFVADVALQAEHQAIDVAKVLQLESQAIVPTDGVSDRQPTRTPPAIAKRIASRARDRPGNG